MKPLLLSILFYVGASANASELILSCSDHSIPTTYGEAHIYLDIFQIKPGKYSSSLEIIIDGQATKRFRQTEYKLDSALEAEILIPVGDVVEVAENGVETVMPGAEIGFTYLTGPHDRGGTATIKFRPSGNSYVSFEYTTSSCHQP